MLYVLVALACLIVGGVVGWLVAERRCLRAAQAQQNAVAAAEQRAADVGQQLAQQEHVLSDVRARHSDSEKQAAAIAAQLTATQQNLIEQKRQLADAEARLKDAFATVSAEALAKNNEAFLELAKQRFETLSTAANGTLEQRKAEIDGLLKPMQEILAQYQTRLVDIEKSRVESYSMLREQLGTLAEVQRTLNTQTGQLVTALRRPNVRGQWGEVTLRRLVELAGLTSRCDFFEQNTIADAASEDGAKQRPDMVVRLPGGREIVIDCKACMDGFLDAASATDEETKRAALVRHAGQVRGRARELSAKGYWSQFAKSPEFVVMFLPGEALFASAVESDASLYEDCLKNRVIVATPTTLLALLRSVEYGWRQEDMTENAEKIRKLGTELYERVRVVTEHVQKLGATLNTTVGHFNTMVGSLESRVLVTARRMGEMGARSDKEIVEVEQIDRTPRALTVVVASNGAAPADVKIEAT